MSVRMLPLASPLTPLIGPLTPLDGPQTPPADPQTPLQALRPLQLVYRLLWLEGGVEGTYSVHATSLSPSASKVKEFSFIKFFNFSCVELMLNCV